MDLFLTNTQFVSSQDVNWWTGVVWIIVMFLSAVWTLILTAPIHCRGSKWWNATFLQIWWRNKLIYIFNGLRVKHIFIFRWTIPIKLWIKDVCRKGFPSGHELEMFPKRSVWSIKYSLYADFHFSNSLIHRLNISVMGSKYHRETLISALKNNLGQISISWCK